jgi:hypothetical protein
LAIVLSVFLFFIWPLYCLSFSFSFGHCIVCLSLFPLALVLFVFLSFFFLSFYCLSCYNLRILTTPFCIFNCFFLVRKWE